MSWLFSRALVVEYLQALCLDGELSALLKSTPIAQAFLCKGKTTESWRRFPSGMTCEPLTASLGEELLTWFREGFRAKISVLPTQREEGLRDHIADSGQNLPVSLAKYDHVTYSWRTPQLLLMTEEQELLERLPDWGIACDGELWAQDTLAPIIDGIESGYVPTPTASDFKGGSMNSKRFAERGPKSNLRDWCSAHFNAAYPPVMAVESLMAWPIGWTDLKPLAMDKFQQWLRSHGGF